MACPVTDNRGARMRIEDEYIGPAVWRPWWFLPAIVGVIAGGAIGFLALPRPLPSCSPPGADSQVVVARFLERMGSSVADIADCWIAGEDRSAELSTYARASAPASYSLTTDPPIGVVFGHGDYERWLLRASWKELPPAGWSSDVPIFVSVLRPAGSSQWKISGASQTPPEGRVSLP